ncbi:MAG TPA: hypothetical protein VHY91_24285 [Pirellulales bacterium]|jgi:hypothetical protein|nr:hypothetical protein [Pirellulales bacterium]
MALDELARRFDLPIDSPEHIDLVETAWFGGELVSVRAYLGRLLERNLFRESDAEVERRMVDYISSLTSKAGGALFRDPQGWMIASSILRFRFEMQTKARSALNARRIAAVEAFLANPSTTLAQLAKQLKTTEKQLNRNSDLTVARRLARFASNAGHTPAARSD